ncbi:MAG: class I SAM-dependent methyltransferase [Actinomycetota bacterium]|nr:class I SAM-dependent methyltransferase [Actinomycetota bacterium]
MPQGRVSIGPAILARLRCPECHAAIHSQNGTLECGAGHQLRYRDGYIDASAAADDPLAARTFASFGYEWNTFNQVVPEDEEFWREYFADVDLTELSGRVGLDAGCGKGRYTRFTARHLEAVVALDGSDAVVAAAQNLRDLPNVAVLKADLQRPPLAEHSFDFISCLGVLHHLGDPRGGFRALTKLLAPGGLLVLYLYSRPATRGLRAAALAAATTMRRVTVRLPHRVLRPLSAGIATVLYGAVVWPGRAGAAGRVYVLQGLPLAAYRRRPLRALWLDTFDRLSAPAEARYLWEEVEGWYREAGLDVEAVSEERGLTIIARRPAKA